MNWPSLSMFSGKTMPVCKGKASVGSVTKMLLHALPPGRIVVIRHRDLDEVAAQELIDRKVKAVINCEETMSGTYPTHGPLLLLQQGIPIWETEPESFERFAQDQVVSLYDEFALLGGSTVACQRFTKEKWLKQFQLAQSNMTYRMNVFIENTLNFAMSERNAVAEPVALPHLQTDLTDRHVLIVSRGRGYKQDLEEARAFIREVRPIFIGVDGGADALLECGYKPHVIIGDMDSVSDKALLCGAELVVHAYRDGAAPGRERVRSLGLDAHVFQCFGTSEDAALLLAYEKRGSWLVTVGAHTHMIDFLEKGREGMGSTLLVRMKIGAQLIDVRGLSVLYRQKASRWRDAVVTVALSACFVGLSLLQMDWITHRLTRVVSRLGGYG